MGEVTKIQLFSEGGLMKKATKTSIYEKMKNGSHIA